MELSKDSLILVTPLSQHAFIFKCFPNLEAELSELNVPSLDDVEMVFSSC